MDTYLISRVPTSIAAGFVDELTASGNRFLGPEYELTARVVVETPEASTVVAYGRNRNNPLAESIFVSRSLVVVFSGYVVESLSDESHWGGYFGALGSDHRPIRKSPGGIYSYATVRRTDGQVSAGHSIPTLEPLYYSSTETGFHVGNHPLLVHEAANGFGHPRISEMFLMRAVGAGVAIDDHTPFVGTLRLAPGAFVSSRGRLLHVRRAPEPAFGSYRVGTTKRRVEAVVEALHESGSILSTLPRGEFRLSGGKDSRVVAAYLKAAGIPVRPVNQNFPQEVEGQVADRVAGVLGEECERIPIETYVDRDLTRAATRKIAFAGGLPAVASLQYPTKSEGGIPGLPLIMGHAHLQRGGFVNNYVRTETEAVVAAKSRTVNPFLKPGFADHNSAIVDEWVDEQLRDRVRLPQVLSYTAYLQYTLNYQFQSLYAYVRNWNLLITPMVDERFALLCQEIAHSEGTFLPGRTHGINDLRTERIAMGVIDVLAPDLLEFPLAGDRFRVDTPEVPGYSARDPELLSQDHIPEEELKRVFNTRRLRGAARGHIWEQIRGRSVAGFGEMMFQPHVWKFVSDPNSEPPPGEDLALLSQCALSLLGFSIIQDTPWWEEIARAPRDWAPANASRRQY